MKASQSVHDCRIVSQTKRGEMNVANAIYCSQKVKVNDLVQCIEATRSFSSMFFSIEISRISIKFSLNLKRKHFVLNSLNSLNSSSSSTILTFKLKLGFMRLLFKSEFCIPIKIVWNGNFSIGFYWRATINATSNKALSELSKRLKD